MGNRIRELRGELRMTQTDFGEELGITQETVSSYENGKIYPSFVQLCRMAEMFNAGIDYIMGLSDVRYTHKVNGREAVLGEIRKSEEQLTVHQLELLNAYAKGLLHT